MNDDPLERIKAEYRALKRRYSKVPDPPLKKRLDNMDRYLEQTFGPGWRYTIGDKQWCDKG